MTDEQTDKLIAAIERAGNGLNRIADIMQHHLQSQEQLQKVAAIADYRNPPKLNRLSDKEREDVRKLWKSQRRKQKSGT